jgi:Cys-tRNA(Pro) deacylase
VPARALNVPEHHIVKTLVMEDQARKPLIVLMHGDRKVSTKNLARQVQRKSIEPCKPQAAQRHTGYLVGGTSPFGTRKPLPVFAERSIRGLGEIHHWWPPRPAPQDPPRRS